jgi:hypothetical protein
MLHESIGHASGQQIEGLTDATMREKLPDYNSLEELRAEINALYMMLAETEVLVKEGLFKDWSAQLTLDELRTHCIIEVTSLLFRRLQDQQPEFTEIKGAHARANISLTNYLLAGGGIEIVGQRVDDFVVNEIKVINYARVFQSVVALLQLVQRIKSTADGPACKDYFDKYLKYPVLIQQAKEYQKQGLAIQRKLIGEVKMRARIYPNYQPVLVNGQIVDVTIEKDQDFITQNLALDKMMMSSTW